MELKKIHIYWCFIQILFAVVILGRYVMLSAMMYMGLPHDPFFLPRYLYMATNAIMIISFIMGLITLPYYFIKNFSSDYKLLSILNQIFPIPYLITGPPLESSIQTLGLFITIILIFLLLLQLQHLLYLWLQPFYPC